MPKTRQNQDLVTQKLQEACARNQAAEFVFHSTNDDTVTARTRFLELQENRVLMEVPSYSVSGPKIPPNRKIEVHFQLGGERFRFASSIDMERTTAKVNEHTKLRAVMVAIPKALQSGQRRADFRISMIDDLNASVVLARRSSKAEHVCDINGAHWDGTVVNLSSGGICALVSDPSFEDVKLHDTVYVTLTLPDAERSFLLLGEVRHQTHVQNSRATKVGMAFRPWPGSSLVTDRQEIAKLIAIRQRIALKRR